MFADEFPKLLHGEPIGVCARVVAEVFRDWLGVHFVQVAPAQFLVPLGQDGVAAVELDGGQGVGDGKGRGVMVDNKGD